MNVEQTKKLTEFIMNQETEITDLRSQVTELKKYIKKLKENENEYIYKDLEIVKYKVELEKLQNQNKELIETLETKRIKYNFNTQFMLDDNKKCMQKIIQYRRRMEDAERQCEQHKQWVINVSEKNSNETKLFKRIRDLLVYNHLMSGLEDDNKLMSVLEGIVFNRSYISSFLSKYKFKNMQELEEAIKRYKSIDSTSINAIPQNQNNINDKEKTELFHYRIKDIVKKGFNTDVLYDIVYGKGSSNVISSSAIVADTPKNLVHVEKENNTSITENNKSKNETIELLHYRVKEIVQKGFNTDTLYDIIDKNKKSNTPRKPKRPTNQIQVVDNIIRRIKNNTRLLKEKNEGYYNLIYTKNRTDIDFYTTIYNDKDFKDIPSKVDMKLDKNTPRLDRTCGIFSFVKSNPGLYNSEYIFNYYTFKSVNSSGLEYLYEKLLELCPTEEQEVDDWSSDTENNICTIESCNNYVPMEGVECKDH